MKVPKVIIAGWTDDLPMIIDKLPLGIEYIGLDQNTPDDYKYPNVDMAVYVFSRKSAGSSQLLSLTAWIHFHVSPPEAVNLLIDDLNLEQWIYDFAKDLPVISIEELCERLKVMLAV